MANCVECKHCAPPNPGKDYRLCTYEVAQPAMPSWAKGYGWREHVEGLFNANIPNGARIVAGGERSCDTFERAEAPPAKTAVPHLSGDACRHCGNFSLVRTGTCQTCQACGETSGCS